MKKIFTFLFAALMSVGMFATTYTVTFTDINSNVKVVENITLPHTFSCDYTNGNGELDLIIQEFYNEPGGRCSTSSWPWGGNNNEVVVGHDGNNHFVTINAPIVGTSFMSGYYDGINESNFYYTFHINIAASEPEPLFEISYEDKWLNIAPADAETPYILWLDSKAFYDGKYTEYTQEKMGGYMDYNVALINDLNMIDLFLLSGEQKIAPNALLDSQGTSPYSLNDECLAFVFKYDATNKQRVSDVEYFVFTYAGEPEQEEGIEHIVLTEKAKKVVVDGMVYIVRDGKMFDLTGAQVR